MILKLGMHHRGLDVYKVYINDNPGMTLTYFMARSNIATYDFEWEKLIQREKHAAKNQTNRILMF